MKLEENKIIEKKINILIYLVQNEYHDNAFKIIKNMLYFWMKKIISRNLNKFPYVPVNYFDLLFYLDLSLLKSVLQFDHLYDIPFKQFAIQQFNWFLLSYLRIYVTKKFKILNYSYNYDENNFQNENYVFKKTIKKTHWINKKEKNKIIYLKGNLSKLEKEIISWKEKGYQNKEISELTNLTKKQISNTWQRIRKKIKLIKI